MITPRESAAALVVLGLSYVSAHGDEAGHGEAEAMAMSGHGHGHGAVDPPRPESEYPPTYFALADHAGLMYAHIALMVLGWIFVLPVGESSFPHLISVL